eukprot:CAMPEP_0115487554 /NCGR_PEP_ID=MMETSP0271-20121206/61015_1 /TAXON_ID=71861 /ORGANISM="Scrippsiella trochoidea, Strain CCMP3099" /LENGTH=100 /DNA_ID=CAMNT_0002915607 /DNA_START=32 /DNA_END=334 /DNA_ORIENTATION=+
MRVEGSSAFPLQNAIPVGCDAKTTFHLQLRCDQFTTSGGHSNGAHNAEGTEQRSVLAAAASWGRRCAWESCRGPPLAAQPWEAVGGPWEQALRLLAHGRS